MKRHDPTFAGWVPLTYRPAHHPQLPGGGAADRQGREERRMGPVGGARGRIEEAPPGPPWPPLYPREELEVAQAGEEDLRRPQQPCLAVVVAISSPCPARGRRPPLPLFARGRRPTKLRRGWQGSCSRPSESCGGGGGRRERSSCKGRGHGAQGLELPYDRGKG
jgi:hypothetical protein